MKKALLIFTSIILLLTIIHFGFFRNNQDARFLRRISNKITGFFNTKSKDLSNAITKQQVKDKFNNSPTNHQDTQVITDDQTSTIDVSPSAEIVDTTNFHFGGDLLWYDVYNKINNAQMFKKVSNDLGLEVARFDIYWGRVERNKGEFDWKSVDELVDSASGQQIIFTLYSTSKWGSKYNDCREEALSALGNPMDLEKVYNSPPSSTPNDMSEYLNFVQQIVSRYKDQVKYWQVENEVYNAGQKKISNCPVSRFWIGTPEEYVELLKQTYSRIKQVDKEAKVLSASIAFTSKRFIGSSFYSGFLDYVFDKGRSYMDIVDVHLYGCVNDTSAKVNFIKTKFNKLGFNKPMWATEIGEVDNVCPDNTQFTSSFDSSAELKKQSEEIVKRHVLAFTSGVKAVLRLKLGAYYDQESPSNQWDHMSLTFDSAGNEPKPGFYTYQIMVKKLKNFTKATKLTDDIYKFEFTDKKPVFVVWSANGKDKSVDLSAYISSEQVKITSLVVELKNGQAVYKDDLIENTANISINNIPLFVE